MSKQEVEVVIDVHEPPEITEAVVAHDEVSGYKIESLPAADLEVSGVGFERKDNSDYAKSLKDGRLEDQTRKLGERYEHAYVLFDGSLVETKNIFKSGMNGASLRGSMASLTAREDSGVQAVIPVSNPSLLVDMAVRLARKHVEDNDGVEFIPQPVDDPDINRTIQMYCCIDGVGPKTAKAIYEEFPSMKDFIHNVDYDSLRRIDGIGEKTALRIIEQVV